MGHMVNIFELLNGKTVSATLQFFLISPSESFYLAQLVKEIPLSKVSLIRALSKLKECGLLSSQQLGKTVLYKLNPKHPLIKELKRFYNISYLLESLQFFQSVECEVYVYGSAARGENDEKSDFDILIISNKKDGVKSLLNKIKDEKIKPIIFTHGEYSLLYRHDLPFYERVEKDKVRLF